MTDSTVEHTDIEKKADDLKNASPVFTEKEESSSKSSVLNEHAALVAAHYNDIKQLGLESRYQSRIFYLRNFNNWIKSVLFQEYINKAKRNTSSKKFCVLDICCGKGGDIKKWAMSNVDHVVFADIANVSLEQCQERYNTMKRDSSLFSAEFIEADCTRERLLTRYKDPSINFNFVSCQFGLHYSFESLPQARQMLNNISERLSAGGYFVGTIPNAYEIVSRARKSPDNSFGNRVYKIKLNFDPKNGYPLFGAKYDFYLDGVVNCPEFLVNFDLLTKLAKQCGLELEYKASFSNFYNEYAEEYPHLLYKIKCFENYPAFRNQSLTGSKEDYEHAEKYLKSNGSDDNNQHKQIGTMSAAEWEVATIYLVFVFKKMKHTLDREGRPVYDQSTNESKQ